MALSRLLQSNFAAGEVSPRILASGDLERYAAAVSRLTNGVVLPLGAVERRSGSIWVEDPRDPAKRGRLLPFVRRVDDAVAVVVNDGKLRFIDVADRSYLEAGGDPVEIDCPWSEADLPYLFTWQSADVLWIGDRRGTAPVQVLQRAAGVWQPLVDLDLRNGPWLADVSGLTVHATNFTGLVTLTASGDVFDPAHVGALVLMRENTGAPPVKRWLANDDVNSGEQRYNAGRVYSTTNTGKSGNNSPIHDEGSVFDGGVSWTFLHDGAGVAKIVEFIDAKHVKAQVQARLPSLVSAYWALGAYSNAAGWPRAASVHHERMTLGGGASTPDTTHLGRVAAYGPTFADFKPGLGTGLVVDSDAVTRALNSGTVQQIVHYVSFERLYAFTSEAVHVISGPSLDEPITPDGASARQRSAFGADWLVEPVKAGDAILFVTPGRAELRELHREAIETPNAALLADHIAGRGLAQLAFAATPYPVCWSRLEDGGLASMTIDQLERVRAWAQHAIGGAGRVESAIVLPEPDGKQALWLYVGREVDGATRYAIEVMPPPWNRHRDPLERACALDAAGFFDFWNTDGDNRARLTVLDHEARAARVETEQDSFDAGDVGRRVALRLSQPANGLDPGAEAKIARVDVMSVIDAKTVEGRIASDGPPALDGAWTLHWALMESVLEVGPRLEGLTVDVFADGSAFADLVVENGRVTLPEPAARGWVGLSCPLELVDLPLAVGSPIGTAFGGRKRIVKAWIVAESAPAGLEVFNPLTGAADPLVLRSPDDPVDRPPTPITGYHAVIPSDAWSDTGQIGVRLRAPFPVTLLGIVKEVEA